MTFSIGDEGGAVPSAELAVERDLVQCAFKNCGLLIVKSIDE